MMRLNDLYEDAAKSYSHLSKHGDKMKTINTNWEAMEQAAILLLRERTVAQSSSEFLALYEEGKTQLIATESLFRPDRERYLKELQATLRKIG